MFKFLVVIWAVGGKQTKFFPAAKEPFLESHYACEFVMSQTDPTEIFVFSDKLGDATMIQKKCGQPFTVTPPKPDPYTEYPLVEN